MITLSAALKTRIEQEVCAVYPNEGCGVLFGAVSDDGSRTVQAFFPVVNSFSADEKYHRFEIDEEAMFRAGREAEKAGLDIIGICHSHPDHPAIPSEYDRVRALPFYSYVIVPVTKDGAGGFRSWILEDGVFREEAVRFDRLIDRPDFIE